MTLVPNVTENWHKETCWSARKNYKQWAWWISLKKSFITHKENKGYLCLMIVFISEKDTAKLYTQFSLPK